MNGSHGVLRFGGCVCNRSGLSLCSDGSLWHFVYLA